MANYTEYKTPDQVNMAWVQSWDMANKVPAIAKRIWGTYADALAFVNDINSTAIAGINLSVVADTDEKKNGLYYVKSIASSSGANDAVLTKVSDISGSIQVEKYSDGLPLATNDNLGQIIYAKNDDTGSYSAYTAGGYMVSGVGSLAKLGTTSAGGDIPGDVERLKGRVSTIEQWAASSITTGDITKWNSAEDNAKAYASAYTDTAIQGLGDNFDVKGSAASALTEAKGYTDTLSASVVTELDKKVDIVEGKGLSTEDFTSEFKGKLEAIESGAQANIIEVIDVNGSAATISGKTAYINIPESAEYSIVKNDTAESGFLSTYRLTKDGVSVGASINIPRDFLVKSASIKVCEEENVPVSGYQVGDKYIDFVVNTLSGASSESHIYLNVKELATVYSGSTYIEITDNNSIELKYNDLKSQLSTDLGISDLATKSSLSELSGNVIAFSASVISEISTLSGESHTHENKSVLDGITSGKVSQWDSAQENVLESVKFNGSALTVSGKAVDVIVNGANIEITKDISGQTFSAASATTVDDVLADIYNALNGLKQESVKLSSSDSSITITETSTASGTSFDVQIKREVATVDTVKEGHIEIQSGATGIYGVMYYIEDSEE